MRATNWGESGVRRVMVISGLQLLSWHWCLPSHFARLRLQRHLASSADVSQPIADQESATETVSIVASPTIDTNSKFFVGCGDGSNGYYAERPEPVLALVRYERMP